MKWIRKSLILIHRYLGIALALIFVVWFVSGVGIMYTKGMPGLTQELRYLRLPPIDLSRIRLTPAEAVDRVVACQPRRGGGARAVVGAILDRPVYRVGGGRGGGTIVYADDGTTLNTIDAGLAKSIASHFLNLPEEKLESSLQSEADQWTIGQRRQMPLH